MHRLLNNVKTTVLMGSLMGLCLAIGYLIGGPNMMVYAFIFVFANLIVDILYSYLNPKITL